MKNASFVFSAEPYPEHSTQQVLNKYLVMVLLKWPWKLLSKLEQTLWDSASEATDTYWAPIY